MTPRRLIAGALASALLLGSWPARAAQALGRAASAKASPLASAPALAVAAAGSPLAAQALELSRAIEQAATDRRLEAARAFIESALSDPDRAGTAAELSRALAGPDELTAAVAALRSSGEEGGAAALQALARLFDHAATARAPAAAPPPETTALASPRLAPAAARQREVPDALRSLDRAAAAPPAEPLKPAPAIAVSFIADPPRPFDSREPRARAWRAIGRGLTRTLLLGHRRSVEGLARRAIQRVALPGDAVTRYTVSFYPSIIPNASMSSDGHMRISLGLLGAARTEDELAGVLAHEMTHANKAQSALPSTKGRIDEALEALPDYARIDAKQREELRADLGAIDRLIAAGYNPWAVYDFERVLTKLSNRLTDQDLAAFLASHPAGEVRMAADKGYVMLRGYGEDISANVAGRAPLPFGLLLLRLRLGALQLPLMHPKIFGGLLSGLLLAQGARFIGPWIRGAVVLGLKGFIVLGAIGLVGYGTLSAVNAVQRWRTRTDPDADVRSRVRALERAAERARRTGGLPADQAAPLLGEAFDLGGKLIEVSTQMREAAVPLALRTLRAGGVLMALLAAQTATLPPAERAAAYESLRPALELAPPRFLDDEAFQRSALSLQDSAGARPAAKARRGETRLGFEDRLRLARAARDFPADAAAAPTLELAHELLGASLADTAAGLVGPRLGSLIDQAYAKGGPNVDEKLLAVMNWLDAGSSPYYHPLAGPRARQDWPRALVVERWRRRKRPPLERAGLAALSWRLPGTESTLWSVRRWWLDWRDRRGLARLFSRPGSIAGLDAFIKGELAPRHVNLDRLTAIFDGLIRAHPEWAARPQDLDALLEQLAFWPTLGNDQTWGSRGPETLLTSALWELHKAYPDLWRFEPAASERLQAHYLAALKRQGREPTDFDGRLRLWRALSGRGVTTRTDEMFHALHAEAPPAKKTELEDAALSGRIWDQAVKARIVARRLRQTDDFWTLTRHPERGPARRRAALARLIKRAEKAMPERGPFLLQALEDLSADALTTREESALIASAKSVTLGEDAQDKTLRALSMLVNDALDWPRKRQWELVRFLRGDLAQSAWVAEKFPIIGPERLRRAYQVLPLAARVALLDGLLDAPRGLLPSVDLSSGYTKTIVDHLLPSGDPEARKTAHEVLEAFLYALGKTGNAALRSYILSYMLAMPPDPDGSPVKTLKSVLEIFGATGVKLGQFLADAELFSEQDSAVLRDLQERAKEPEREQLYRDLDAIFGAQPIPFRVRRLVGAASVKYAFLAEKARRGGTLVGKVFRTEAFAHTNAEFEQLRHMADYLSRKRGARYGIFSSIVRVSRQAVRRELSAENEIAMSREAARLYDSPDGSFGAPIEVLTHPRLIAAEFAPGESIFNVFKQRPAAAQAAAAAIIARERSILFADEETITFDPDRHAGNYRVEVAADGHVRVRAIDFGQLLTITRAQREQVFDLLALSQILKQTGATGWAAEETASILGLPARTRGRLRRELGRFFPGENLSPVSAYYALLAALERAGQPPDIVAFDYVRAISRLATYERFAPEAPSAKAEMAARVEPRARAMAERMTLTSWEKLRLWATRD